MIGVCSRWLIDCIAGRTNSPTASVKALTSVDEVCVCNPVHFLISTVVHVDTESSHNPRHARQEQSEPLFSLTLSFRWSQRLWEDV